MANKRKHFKLPDPRVGEVYYDRDNNAYLRIRTIDEYDISFDLKDTLDTVYKPSYELSKDTFLFNVERGRFVKWSPTVRILYT